MRTVRLRSVELGTGRPKVCVPLVAGSLPALAELAASLDTTDLDLVELRLDYLAGVAEDQSMADDAIAVIRSLLPDPVPMLVTFRTQREGGEQPVSHERYRALALGAVRTGLIDAIDVEMDTPREDLDTIVADAHAHSVAVVMSNHDFHSTPPKEEIVARLRRQQDLGADVVKIAVMPNSARDVITLLDATEEFVSRWADRPAITMSMGPLGAISRLAGETVGSCLSFGQLGTASAPGQFDAADLRHILDLLHRGASPA